MELSEDEFPDFHTQESYHNTLPLWNRNTDFIGTLFAIVYCKYCDTATFTENLLVNLEEMAQILPEPVADETVKTTDI